MEMLQTDYSGKIEPYMQETGLNETKTSSVASIISILFTNIKCHCSILIAKESPAELINKYKIVILGQIKALDYYENIIDIRKVMAEDDVDFKQFMEGFLLFRNLDNFRDVCLELIKIKGDIEEEKHAKEVFSNLMKNLAQMIQNQDTTIEKLERYDIFDKNEEEYEQDFEVKNLGEDHFLREKIHTNIQLGPRVFKEIEPPLHRIYISEAAKVCSSITPVKIKHIMTGLNLPMDRPEINIPNYYLPQVQQNMAILAHCIPDSNRVGYYSLADISKISSMEKEYYQERKLDINWQFGQFTRSTITPDGKMYAINCKTTESKIDPYMYEILETRASNRGPIPKPRSQSSFLYANKALYILGGYQEGEKCSNRHYKYCLRKKKWSAICNSNIALRKPTVCSFNNRWIFKLGGMNQFDYISKVVEVYDTINNTWSLARVSPRNIMEEIQVLEDALCVQINPEQIYVFSGKNRNNCQVDTGFVLTVTELVDRHKKSAKVAGELWNVSASKRNILTHMGLLSMSNVLVYNNCVYALRQQRHPLLQ